MDSNNEYTIWKKTSILYFAIKAFATTLLMTLICFCLYIFIKTSEIDSNQFGYIILIDLLVIAPFNTLILSCVYITKGKIVLYKNITLAIESMIYCIGLLCEVHFISFFENVFKDSILNIIVLLCLPYIVIVPTLFITTYLKSQGIKHHRINN